MEENLESITKRRDTEHDIHVRNRMAELGPIEAGLETSYNQDKIGAYVAIIGLALGLGLAYGSKIYEAIEKLF